jgi:hypothetical protein
LWVPFFTVAGPTKFISPVFSLSPPLLLCLSLSPLGHYRYGLLPRLSLFINLAQIHCPLKPTSFKPKPRSSNSKPKKREEQESRERSRSERKGKKKEEKK